jgi:hypothetical protein
MSCCDLLIDRPDERNRLAMQTGKLTELLEEKDNGKKILNSDVK